jgi:hypothetical protein
VLRYEVRWGDEVGVILTPHKHRDGKYVASKTKSGPHQRVDSIEELKSYLGRGWSIRMSNGDSKNHRGASLITPDSVSGWT